MNDIIFDMPDAEYRSAVGVSHSALKRIAQSPAHYRYARFNPPARTQAMTLGQLFHLALFEPQKPRECVVRPPGMNFTTKEGKAWRDTQTLPIITAAEDDMILGMVDSLRANPQAAAWLASGKAEVSLFADHEETGLQLKGRVDWMVSGDEAIFLDAKTCECAADFEREGAQRRYYQQEAYYRDLAAANGVEVSRFVFLVAEKEPPYGVRLIEFDAEAVDIGRATYRAQLETLARCQKNDQWPGYRATPETIRLPGWLRSAAELEQLQ